jgi:acyl dehydratase
MADSLITPEVRALIGSETEPEKNRFPLSDEMAYDLADATEDPNPLYVDRAVAEASRFKGLICPPLATWKDIAPSIGYFGAGQESHFDVPLPFNSYGLNGGSDWQFLRPAYTGDWVTRQFKVIDVFEKEGRSGPLVFIIRRETQTNQHGDAISVADRVSIHRSRPAEDEVAAIADSGLGLESVVISPPSPDHIVPRPAYSGGQQKNFEDISVGMELEKVVKGPITTTHLVRWAAANGNYARIHWDLPFAQIHQGLPNVVVNGSLKNQYLGQLMIKLAGPGGWFKRFYVEHRGMDFPGDVITASGIVTAIREVGSYGYVDCDVNLTNDRGDRTAFGKGTVVLPKKNQSLPLIWELET